MSARCGGSWSHRPPISRQRGEPKTPQAIASHATIQFGATSAPPDWRFVEDGREIRIACTPRFATNSADAAIQYAEQGGGLTRVLAYQAAAAIKAGRLKIVLAKFEEPPLPIHIVYPTSRLLSAKVRASSIWWSRAATGISARHVSLRDATIARTRILSHGFRVRA